VAEEETEEGQETTEEEEFKPYLCGVCIGSCTEGKTGFRHSVHSHNRGGRLGMHIHCKPQRARLQPSTQHHPHRFDKCGPSHDSEALAAAAADKRKTHTEISVSPFCGTHSFVWITLSLSLSESKAETKEGHSQSHTDPSFLHSIPECH